MKRARLVLARETLSRLSPEDLAEINGGSMSYPGCITHYTGLTRCTVCDIEYDLTGVCDTLRCPTAP